MSTRLKRPSFWRQLLLASGLIAFQGYLAFNVVSGQFGVESRRDMQVRIEELRAKSGALQAEIDAYRHRVALFDPLRLDPDIVSERARALLSMAQPDEIIVRVDAAGKPIFSSFDELPENELIGVIPAPPIR